MSYQNSVYGITLYFDELLEEQHVEQLRDEIRDVLLKHYADNPRHVEYLHIFRAGVCDETKRPRPNRQAGVHGVN